MNASDLTFGVEIETTAGAAATAAGLQVGGYHSGRQVPYLPAGWKASSDSSIRATPGRFGAEIVSPVLKGIEGLRQVAQVIATLKAKGHEVNETCGVHVHIGWTTNDASTLARLVTIVAYLEAGLFAVTGTKSRERGHHGRSYCKGIKQHGTAATAQRQASGDRYHILNLTNLAMGTRNTVEFRVFSGSLNATKILAWIQIALGIVERAHTTKRSPDFAPTAPTGGWKKAGPGQSETERLIGYLAWAPGTAKIHGGKSFGWIADDTLLDRKTAMNTLRTMAAKYDAQA